MKTLISGSLRIRHENNVSFQGEELLLELAGIIRIPCIRRSVRTRWPGTLFSRVDCQLSCARENDVVH